MAELYNISEWEEKLGVDAVGTRNKKIYIEPNSNNDDDDDLNFYYFKESYNKGNRDYKYEFWSEIIASEERKFTLGSFMSKKVLHLNLL